MTNITYLDCNATTPLEPKVREVLLYYLTQDYGNEGSRTHEFGARAKRAVQQARDQIAAVVGAKRNEVIFTSGATESNNLAILGLKSHASSVNRRHVVCSQIEHKAVLEPVQFLEQNGFEVTWVGCDAWGRVDVDQIRSALRPETVLVTLMAANNETGVRQPLEEVCEILKNHDAFFHTDAAQLFGKEFDALRNPRIDLISVSGHKIFAPKGIGALIARRRGYSRIPLAPLFYGGGQEQGLRPGTLPVALIVAMGEAAAIAMKDHEARKSYCRNFKMKMLQALQPLNPRIHGRPEETMENVVNLAFPGINSEALMLALKDLIAISNGSACTSSSYTPSHVLKAMRLGEAEATEAVRLSWCHLTPKVDWEQVVQRIRCLM